MYVCMYCSISNYRYRSIVGTAGTCWNRFVLYDVGDYVHERVEKSTNLPVDCSTDLDILVFVGRQMCVLNDKRYKLSIIFSRSEADAVLIGKQQTAVNIRVALWWMRLH